MMSSIALFTGFLLDQLLGDPPSWPHPVRGIGRSIASLESVLRRIFPPRLGGVFLLLIVCGLTGGMTWGVLELADGWHPLARLATASILIYYGLAARGLARETEAVLKSCDRADWKEARSRLGRIVGRDTHDLPPEEIHRACIETVAENTTDGVIAPLFYAALFGPVGMWIYKAISTLDSMVGYRNETYRYFGWASARADDVANFVPARLTYLLLSLAALLSGQRGKQALRVGWRDGRKHPSPNSAWAEAAMAGALGVRLGGPSRYRGVVSEKPLLGDGEEPLSLAKARQGIRVMLGTAWLGLLVCLPFGDASWHGRFPRFRETSLTIEEGTLPVKRLAVAVGHDAVKLPHVGVKHQRQEMPIAFPQRQIQHAADFDPFQRAFRVFPERLPAPAHDQEKETKPIFALLAEARPVNGATQG